MAKLCQINALVSGRKGEVEKAVMEVYKVLQKPELFTGRERVYHPRDEEGEVLPPENQKIQFTAKALLEEAARRWTELWDLVAVQDEANQHAVADVVVDGKVVLAKVPVTTLLFLEKQVNDLETFLGKLPVPDPAYDWAPDNVSSFLRSRPTQTIRTKKVPKAFIKYEATKEHPAQVEAFTEDVPVGTWTQILFSGAMDQARKNVLITRVKQLKDAVKVAREAANLMEVPTRSVGKEVFSYLMQA